MDRKREKGISSFELKSLHLFLHKNIGHFVYLPELRVTDKKNKSGIFLKVRFKLNTI